MCARDSTRRAIGWRDCCRGEAGQEGEGRALRGGSRTLLAVPHSQSAGLEAHWSLWRGAGKAARASRSSSPLCRPFPWTWLSVIRLEAVVTTGWRHELDPSLSPELGPHHGLPLLAPRAAQHFPAPPRPTPTSPPTPPTPASERGPRAQPPPWDPGAGGAAGPAFGGDGWLPGGDTHIMVAWDGTVHAINCWAWGTGT